MGLEWTGWTLMVVGPGVRLRSTPLRPIPPPFAGHHRSALDFLLKRGMTVASRRGYDTVVQPPLSAPVRRHPANPKMPTLRAARHHGHNGCFCEPLPGGQAKE